MNNDTTTDLALPKIVSGDDYIESLRGRHLKVYLFGELVAEPVDHPMIRPSINAMARTYDLALQHPDLATIFWVTPRGRSSSSLFLPWRRPSQP